MKKNKTKDIAIKVSNENEGTESPYWLILDPKQNMSCSIHALASQIIGVFFSREEAQQYLDSRQYAFSEKARVYCQSGYASRQYKEACRKARIGY